MDYFALRDEIALPAYAGLSDTEIAVVLNAETVATIRDVPTHEARALLLATGEWAAIVLAARAGNAYAITAEDTLRLTETLQVASNAAYWQAVQTLLGALVTDGALSSGTRDALLALRDTTTSRAAQLGLGVVQPCDVQTARLV